jgi:hypothetical protein
MNFLFFTPSTPDFPVRQKCLAASSAITKYKSLYTENCSSSPQCRASSVTYKEKGYAINEILVEIFKKESEHI